MQYLYYRSGRLVCYPFAYCGEFSVNAGSVPVLKIVLLKLFFASQMCFRRNGYASVLRDHVKTSVIHLRQRKEAFYHTKIVTGVVNE
ncbi:hypothetical protein KL86DPRO_11174 [uncultured delta proteobacterium]|uniref:Uncharacterized protein n=1 Tax=uncultured delta proteobacterium TaxID=34034 RepID=A0A212JCS4_9DELT|nr:hypothetical protein KL86DPRO_11174 [uncultured delta proteobacterium]